MQVASVINKKNSKYFTITIVISIIIHGLMFLLILGNNSSENNQKIVDKIRFKLNPSRPSSSFSNAQLLEEIKDFRLSNKTKINEQSAIDNNSNSKNKSKASSDYKASNMKYEDALPLWLNRFRKYPEQAKNNAIEGVAEVFIKLDRKGNIINYKITKSTNYKILDDAIYQMLQDANPAIAPKADYMPNYQYLSYKINFEFKL